MKVIGVGFGRTGTSSLAQALDRLGFGPCYHMFTVVSQPYRIQHWLDAARHGTADWDGMFAGFETVLDFPAVAFWRELVDHYPQAKVILTVRDPERWYDSATRTIFRNAIALERSSLPQRAAFGLVTRLSPDFARFTRMVDATVVRRLFGGPLGDRTRAVDAFRRHVAAVRAHVPDDRLLVYDVSTGWSPLCGFLGVPVPVGEAFPRGNDAAEFHREEGRRMRRLVLDSMLRRNRRVPAGAIEGSRP